MPYVYLRNPGQIFGLSEETSDDLLSVVAGRVARRNSSARYIQHSFSTDGHMDNQKEKRIHRHGAEHKGTGVVERSCQGRTVMAMLFTAEINMAARYSKNCTFQQVQYKTGLFPVRTRWMIR